MTIEPRLRTFIMDDPLVTRSAFDQCYEADLAATIGDTDQALFALTMAGFQGEIGPGSATIAFLRRELDPIRDHMALCALSVAAAMLLRGAELALLVDGPKHPGWLRLPGSDSIVTATAASLLDGRYRKFNSNGQ